jgi:DNA-binding XRE family transcriptional regulator
MKLPDIINGTLLGDASVRIDKSKYYYYSLNAKDKNFLCWVKTLLERFNIPTYITVNNIVSKVFTLGFYINARKSQELLKLRSKWYKQENGKTAKIIPFDLKITPITVLFWYLGDGSLIRRKNDSNRVPFIVLATNTFSKDDVDFLIEKLKELELNFYPVKYKSGFTGKACGYCLYSNTQDGTPFRFFKLIGFKCQKEIANFSTGRRGIYREEKFFKDKWPREEDWIKILSNIKEIANMLKEKRKQLGLTQREVAKLVGTTREHVRDIENGRRCASVAVFKPLLKALNLDVAYLLKELNKNTCIGG